MTRFVSVCVAVVMASSTLAYADGTLPTGHKIKFDKFLIPDDDGDFNKPVTADAARFFLNFAHCECGRQAAGPAQKFRYEVVLDPPTTTGINKPAEVWVGTKCDDDTVRELNCRKVAEIGNIDTLAVRPGQIELTTFQVINVKNNDPMTATCELREGNALIWLLVSTNGGSSYDYTTSQALGGTATDSEVATVDTKAPTLPTGFRATSGEEAIEISWTPPTADTDIYFYQALCIDDQGEPIGGPKARFETTDLVCQQPQNIELVETPIAGGDGTPFTEIPEPFKTLDTRFVCGEAPATAKSLIIGEIENGRAYKVALLAIDRYGNPSGVYFNRTITPQPVTDLWEDLHDRNSAVDGGCLLSQTYGEGNPLTRVLRDFRDTTLARSGYGRALIHAYYATLGKLSVEGSIVLRVIAAIYLAPLVIIALLWHLLTLPGLLALVAAIALRRRIKRLVLALALLAPSLATADDFQPYWATDEAEDPSLLHYSDVTWHVGIRFGAYIPEIDLQAGLNAKTGMGPYEAMFGDYYLRDGNGVLKKHKQRVWQVLPVLDVDRVLWEGFGQLTVGGSIGYMQKSAYAYLDGTTEDDAMRERSRAGKNTFRLIPAAATVGFRFTYLDDAFGIPVVPYVRGGLSYYAWWIKAPSGHVSKVCDETSVDGMCVKENKAYGGSLGFQGSVGIAIRAERIDASAATSMRNGGIAHAGFYAEFQYAKVDGFGSDKKLSVGDNTWFAGVNFEF